MKNSALIDAYDMLKNIADGIGNGADVEFLLVRHGILGDAMKIRVDWPNDFHFMYRFAVEDLIVGNAVVVEYIINLAKHEYEKKMNQ
jgi:hypothetical protein